MWDADQDSFKYQVNLTNKPNTRRGILSNVASIFDPLGLVSPIILQGKANLQDICREKLDWDDPLNPPVLNQWTTWKETLNDLSQLSIPRCYKPPSIGDPTKIELHTFSDASTKGYGQCTYLRLVDSTNHVHVTLISSKARVTPLKSVTVPRLELQAARGAIELCQKVESELNLSNPRKFFYSDSEVVLSYIKNTEARYHTYVANRIDQIRDGSDPSQWFHVPTAINPADHASRGLSPKQLLSQSCRWFAGPEFLWQEPIAIPAQPKVDLAANNAEVKVTLTTNTKPIFAPLSQRISIFSNLDHALKIITRIQNMIQKGNLTQNEARQRALHTLIKGIQSEFFNSELNQLKCTQSVTKHSSIIRLNPFVDEGGLLRVGGRLQASNILSYEEKHPLLLPKGCHLTNLIIGHAHYKSGHLGADYTLSRIRSQGLWIVNGKAAVSSRLRQCVICKKIKAKPVNPLMATLPAVRVNEDPPFTHCGLDCFGPFLVKDGRKESKRYGLIVTCMASRSVHIELLEDMSTDSFINAIRVLVAIRGPIQTIISDQGTNFMGAAKDLQSTVTSSMNIDMKFNPPNSSSMGGVWERQIRTIRSVLKGLGQKHGGRFSTATLRVIFYEVMAIINSRPLTTISEDNHPLTPNMLLTMKSEVVLPPPSKFTDSDIYSRKRWRTVQQIANQFWQLWRKQYLLNLQARQKWVKKTPDVQVNDIVIVCDDNLVRNEWKLARIVECTKSHDGIVRSVKLLMASKLYPKDKNKRQYLTRPVSKIVVLVKAT